MGNYMEFFALLLVLFEEFCISRGGRELELPSGRAVSFSFNCYKCCAKLY